MRNRPTKRPGLPAPPREERPPLPEFVPVPRKYRHDGWTPARQKAFIEALADCGSVTRAAAMVNMAQANCYTLRRAPGAEGFRRAWDAALDFGVKRLKDVAFERAIEGQLYPVFRGEKLVGFHRRKNDALLMFCLRHYGEDANGKRTTINYFSTRATAGAAGSGSGEGGAVAGAEASTTTVRTVINGSGERADPDAAPALLQQFAGVPLDAEAQGAIAAALEACAARARFADEATGEDAADCAEVDPDAPYVRVPAKGSEYRASMEPPFELVDWVPFTEGEQAWQLAGAEIPEWPDEPDEPGGEGRNEANES
jgi:hypothetical protein